MFQAFEIAISFSLGKREEDLAKGGVDNLRRKHGNKGVKTVKM